MDFSKALGPSEWSRLFGQSLRCAVGGWRYIEGDQHCRRLALAAPGSRALFVQFWQTLGILSRTSEAGRFVVLGELRHRLSHGLILNTGEEFFRSMRWGLAPALLGEHSRHTLIPNGCGQARRLLRTSRQLTAAKCLPQPPCVSG